MQQHAHKHEGRHRIIAITVKMSGIIPYTIKGSSIENDSTSAVVIVFVAM